jgi:hypothetical protein
VLQEDHDRNAPPSVVFITSSSLELDESNEIAIRYRLYDPEGNPAHVVFQYAVQDPATGSFPEIPSIPPEAGNPSAFEALLADPEKRKTYQILTEAPLSVEGRVDAAGEPCENGFVEKDFVRRGLAALKGGQPLIVGRTIALLDDSGAILSIATVSSLDVATNRITVHPSFSIPARPGMRWRLRADEGMLGLAASPGGVLHTFLWDSLADVSYGNRLKVRLRITPMAGKVGSAAERDFLVDNGPLADQRIVGLLTASRNPWGVATGDLDGDGRDDVVLTSSLIGGETRIRYGLQDRDGLFVSMSVVADEPSECSTPLGIAVGNIFGDSRPEVVAANNGSNNLNLLEVIDTTYGPKLRYADASIVGTEAEPFGVAIGNLLGDATPEVVVTNSASHTLSIFTTDGTGLIPFGESLKLGEGATPMGVALLDLNGDSKMEVAVACFGSDTVMIFTEGGANLIEYGQLPVNAPVDLDAGDLDGDGLPDLAVAWGGNKLEVYLQQAGTLTARTTCSLQPTDAFREIAIGDLNGDATPDLAGTTTLGLSIFLQTSDASFGPEISFLAGDSPRGIGLGDFNGDGRTDGIIANYIDDNLSLFLQNTPGILVFQDSLATYDRPGTAAMGDIRGDGLPDIVISNEDGPFSDSFVSVFLQEPKGEFATQFLLPVHKSPMAVALADADGDGVNDIAAVHKTSGGAILYYSMGSGSLEFFESPIIREGRFNAVQFGDFNGDGLFDVAATDDASHMLSIYLSGTTPELRRYSQGIDSPRAIAVADIQGDGRDDLLVANKGGDTVSLFIQGTDGNLHDATPLLLSPQDEPYALGTGDLNDDGRLDVAVSNEGSDEIALFFQKGDGSFEAATRIPVRTNYEGRGLVVADLNGDGADDIAMIAHPSISPGNSKLVLFFQEAGILTLQPFVDLPKNNNAGHLTAGDINGDGRTDLIIPYAGLDEAGIFIQR